MKFLYPGHNYLGPGNPLNNGTPVSNADRIAEKHDWQYHEATSQEEIFKSDQQAIGLFAADFLKSPNLASASGAVGLAIKHGTESLIGNVIYPSLGKECPKILLPYGT